jgi:hypothetical protein
VALEHTELLGDRAAIPAKTPGDATHYGASKFVRFGPAS